MALGISGFGITGTLSNGDVTSDVALKQSDSLKFQRLVDEAKKAKSSHRLNGDYTQGFENTFTAEKDKTAAPQGMARNAKTRDGKNVVIDKTSSLYEQSMEMENYLMKIMLSSMRSTIHHTSLTGDENDYARKMYEDMMYDNLAESLTKNSATGLADQIYIELSGQR